jgi:phage terminase large subunit-like protein
VWRAANPGYGDIVDPEDFASAGLKTPENEFRTKRFNEWVSSAQAWLPAGSWDACEAEGRAIPDRARVVLGFDGSRTGDNTGIIAVEVGEKPFVEVAGLWERPQAATEWQVPRSEVKDAIRAACKRWDVLEIAWDPYLWLDAAEELLDERLPVVEFPQNQSRMAPAVQRFYELVTTRGGPRSGPGRRSSIP